MFVGPLPVILEAFLMFIKQVLQVQHALAANMSSVS